MTRIARGGARMIFLLSVLAITTAIAIASALSADYAPIQQKMLPWTAGFAAR